MAISLNHGVVPGNGNRDPQRGVLQGRVRDSDGEGAALLLKDDGERAARGSDHVNGARGPEVARPDRERRFLDRLMLPSFCRICTVGLAA